jgi:hypothetical protein
LTFSLAASLLVRLLPPSSLSSSVISSQKPSLITKSASLLLAVTVAFASPLEHLSQLNQVFSCVIVYNWLSPLEGRDHGSTRVAATFWFVTFSEWERKEWGEKGKNEGRKAGYWEGGKGKWLLLSLSFPLCLSALPPPQGQGYLNNVPLCITSPGGHTHIITVQLFHCCRKDTLSWLAFPTLTQASPSVLAPFQSYHENA